MLWLLAEDWRVSILAQRWPTTAGRITSSTVDRCVMCDDPTDHVSVSYEYMVEGQPHTG